MKRIVFAGMLILFGAAAVPAQHRGDNLGFQGLSQPNDVSAQALAVGNALTAVPGAAAAVHFNPAGLAGVEHLEVTVAGSRYSKLWRENQAFRPNRFEFTLPFYLEGLYTPDPANNGRWDYEIFIEQRDSAYVVQDPVLGADPYGKKAADWERTANGSLLDNVSVAVPVHLGGRPLVLAVSYNARFRVEDFDRNDTYLDPMIGYDAYGVAQRVANDTLRMDWFRYLRHRTGTIHQVEIAAGYKLRKNLSVGARIGRFSGTTSDILSLNKVGWFDLVKDNRFRFSYDTLDVAQHGSSKFQATQVSAGLIWQLNRLYLGLKLTAPYTIRRTWSATTTTLSKQGMQQTPQSGEDRLSVPLSYAVGFAFWPHPRLRLTLDVETILYSKGKMEMVQPDSVHGGWADQNIVRMGVAYSPAAWLTLMAGYRNLPQTFVPDGAALKHQGPAAQSYTAGLALRLPLGRLVLAYETRQLKYYDSYYSQTNYALETLKRLVVEYTFRL